MNLKTSLYTTFGLLILLCIGGICYDTLYTKKSPYELEVLEIEQGGYGYKITRYEKTIIYQPFIPGLNNRKSFSCAEDARRTGTLVKKRLESNKNISVSVDDLKKMNISGAGH